MAKKKKPAGQDKLPRKRSREDRLHDLQHTITHRFSKEQKANMGGRAQAIREIYHTAPTTKSALRKIDASKPIKKKVGPSKLKPQQPKKKIKPRAPKKQRT